MPLELTPLSESTETLSPLTEGAETLGALTEDAQTLSPLAELVAAAATYLGGTWASLVTFPSANTFPSSRVELTPAVDGLDLTPSADGSLDLTPLQED